MAKTLKKWNGRGHGKYNRQHIYIAAYTQKQAAEILSTITHGNGMLSEIRNYYSQCWGIAMDGIEPTEPCLYVMPEFSNKTPTLIYPS